MKKLILLLIILSFSLSFYSQETNMITGKGFWIQSEMNVGKNANGTNVHLWDNHNAPQVYYIVHKIRYNQ